MLIMAALPHIFTTRSHLQSHHHLTASKPQPITTKLQFQFTSSINSKQLDHNHHKNQAIKHPEPWLPFTLTAPNQSYPISKSIINPSPPNLQFQYQNPIPHGFTNSNSRHYSQPLITTILSPPQNATIPINQNLPYPWQRPYPISHQNSQPQSTATNHHRCKKNRKTIKEQIEKERRNGRAEMEKKRRKTENRKKDEEQLGPEAERMRNEEKARTDPRKKEMKKWTCPAEPVPNPCSGRLTHDDAVSLQVAAAIHYKPRRCRQPQTKPSPSEDEKEDEMTERRMKTRFRKEGVRAGKKEKK